MKEKDKKNFNEACGIRIKNHSLSHICCHLILSIEALFLHDFVLKTEDMTREIHELIIRVFIRVLLINCVFFYNNKKGNSRCDMQRESKRYEGITECFHQGSFA